VVGVDLSLPMLRHASPRLPGGVARADARRLPCRDGCADAVVLCWVLHAVGDPVAAMTEAARALRPGGRAFVFEGDNVEEGDVTLPAIYRRVAAHAGRPPGDERYGIALDAAARAGFELVAEELTPARRWGQTPADLAETLRQRGAGFLDRMDDATFARVVEPAIDELLAMPEPDPRLRVSRHRLAVLQHE
jgi:SAM-dependent methyltransferase